MPTEEEIEQLHRKHAPTPEFFDLVYTHCCVVRDVANQLIQKSSLKVDVELVRAGCLLHDIGVYRLYNNGEIGDRNYIRHGILGYELLREEGFSETLCRFASHHTGVGITKEDIERQNLPLPHEDFLAETDEERLVMYADKFHSKTEPPKFNTSESYRSRLTQFGEDHVAEFDKMIQEFGLPELKVLSAKYGHQII